MAQDEPAAVRDSGFRTSLGDGRVGFAGESIGLSQQPTIRGSGGSPSAVTAICARCSCTAPALFCAGLNASRKRSRRALRGCAKWDERTSPRWQWPIETHASPGRRSGVARRIKTDMCPECRLRGKGFLTMFRTIAREIERWRNGVHPRTGQTRQALGASSFDDEFGRWFADSIRARSRPKTLQRKAGYKTASPCAR